MRDVKEPEVRRAEIMEAALLLFMEKGYMNTTTQDIIDKVKISRGLLYYHFKNKEDILYCMVERYSEPLLRNLSAISYDKDKSAIEKIRSFLEVTLISTDTITNEMVELQKTVDLEQNRYMMDKFSHNFIRKVTAYFTYIIEQGVSEKVFYVEYPSETAYFLMTGYVFASNDMNALYLDEEKANGYFIAFKTLLARALGTDPSIFNS
ncbi:TetR/AcrR family transcriptional regulator [Sedimentibacter hydroxybenzoicus DSM 7310]|uniref:TetR/AcrR family transcriptional regulator n=1 Tax=Sedimentibacter hydroxybenzoicus DSM 7310 TaxID=1123245 RepID=A0A974BN28_SEDHY|nr:TetR/AcrR family transcriptional regulator [Sedimentibacter hydroxybenzoicus]NYB75665.1 TetR/AcrR family transcriptional regulator [Sedimentibacter hydroxybenzoicus DSM 7310]